MPDFSEIHSQPPEANHVSRTPLLMLLILNIGHIGFMSNDEFSRINKLKNKLTFGKVGMVPIALSIILQIEEG